jgi:hypothetical protein
MKIATPLRFLSFNQLLGKFGQSKILVFLTLFFFSLLASENANAVTVVINGPTSVCPKNGTLHTYTAQSFQWPLGFELNNCSFTWVVYKGIEIVGGGYGQTFSYRFDDIGIYEIKVSSSCPLHVPGSKIISVNSRVIPPNPISGSTMCFTGQNYSFSSSPSLSSQNPYGSDCYYHFAYLWTAPTGWSITAPNINSTGNTLFAQVETVNISAPVGTPPGSYTISVQSSIPNGAGLPYQTNSWFSAPVTYTVQVGPFSTSQVAVSGTLAVCNGNSYTYTANVPGGHKIGYTYNWTYPSGWSVENTSSNTIRLYIPSNNSSYGPVRVSINNGCGTTPFTGLTVFPCGYMMSSGDFQIYPNPASGEINVEYIVEENFQKNSSSIEFGNNYSNQNDQSFKIEIFDRSEKMVKSAISKEGKVHLETNGLIPGTYFLHIYFGKEVRREQILIQ